jgi:hypothetical protein
MERKNRPLVNVLLWCLVIIIGGIGWLAVSFGPTVWHVAAGLPLCFLAAWLVRLANRDA